MKRFVELMLLCISFISFSKAEVVSGSCGSNMTWSFNTETGLLTFAGFGTMNVYADGQQPWYSYMSAVRQVNIASSISSINTNTLAGCNNLEQASYPVVLSGLIPALSCEAPSKQDTAGYEQGHKWVDLGLPSGTKWATCNVGASQPEDYGDYFAWGETSAKTNYAWSTYKYCKGTQKSLTKYCTNSQYGTVDNITVLEINDDAPNLLWGGNWHMPVDSDWIELLANCTWTWENRDGVYGYKVTSKVPNNSNYIFLPAAGYRYAKNISSTGSRGYYWSSSLYDISTSQAYYVAFSSSNANSRYRYRYYGVSIRPIMLIPAGY